jgi:two-component system sensor histidine kinase LytS
VTGRRTTLIDFMIAAAIAALAMLATLGLVSDSVSNWYPVAALAGLVVLAAALVVTRIITRPDHVRALQSHKTLEIANASLQHLRQGLNAASAQEVCRITLEETDAAAVAITDRECVLGFAGMGEDHHEVGGPIITRATQEVLESGGTRVLLNREDIGCPRRECVLRAAIVVPLMVRSEPVGTLKFYYTTPRLLNETQIAMAEGLALLLSTQLELSELERQTELATRMELKALQAQINPHFLFNTINTIAALIRTDPPQARELLREFAVFYRRTLESGEDMVPLERELDYVHTYLTFETARFGERLQVSESIDDDLFDLLVPAFVLQPLVENSIQHGMRPDGRLSIGISSEVTPEGDVALRVVDNGVGITHADLTRVLEPGFGKGLGIALKNVDDRLKGYYGPRSGVTIRSAKGQGTTVTLLLEGAAAEESSE